MSQQSGQPLSSYLTPLLLLLWPKLLCSYGSVFGFQIEFRAQAPFPLFHCPEAHDSTLLLIFPC